MDIQTTLATIPTSPGVYLFKDAKHAILYVGKAKNLRVRVRSYFRTHATLDPAKQNMVQKVRDMETITTDNETEALVLEANLIHKHQPPYNVVLRDDKYYLFIKLTEKDGNLRIFPTRKIRKDGATYFGPYSSAQSVRTTLALLRRIFPFQEEKDRPRDIIFPHPLFPTDNAAHTSAQHITQFLRGHREEIVRTLQQGMKQASRKEHYEQAAVFRDQLDAIQRLEGSQKVHLPNNESFDCISIARKGAQSAANVFQVRKGKLLGKHTFFLRHHSNTPKQDVLRQFLLQYYKVAQDIPSTILTPFSLSDTQALQAWVRKDKPPTISVPQRGKKRHLLDMGTKNAQHALNTQRTSLDTRKAQHELFDAIGINPVERSRIETYDISNIQGTLATASMVVFIDGKPMPKEYKKFRIRGKSTPDDFAMLQEAIKRRFARTQTKQDWPMPDLILIDGGKGQLSSVQRTLDEHKVDIPVVSIAKREEEIFVPGKKESVRLPHDSTALYLIQQMRDEAHRFTITYHRLLRSKAQKRSILDEVPGIGPKTKKKLLQTFGSLKRIRTASDKDLTEVIGSKKTKTLREYI